jgi:diketogulonate reductase-like aldo/keto reductase
MPAVGLGVFQTPPDETRDAVRAALDAGQRDIDIDLLILHQALPSAFDRTLEAYRALETLLADGKVCAIGFSNFMVDHLGRLLDRAPVVPAANQRAAPVLRPG